MAEHIAITIIEALASFTYKERQKIKDKNRDTVNWVFRESYVFFDFSSWAEADLNIETTSYFTGIPRGRLVITSSSKKWEMPCTNTLTGSDIVYIYKWCRSHSGTPNSQRRFRFENGKYEGEGPVKSWIKGAGIGAGVGTVGSIALVGLLAAFSGGKARS